MLLIGFAALGFAGWRARSNVPPQSPLMVAISLEESVRL